MNKVINYYNEIANDYYHSRFENSYGKFIDKQERIILDGLLTNKNEVVLDLACGVGRLLNYATLGLDASEKMVALARKTNSDKKIILANAEETGIETNSIDTIICFHFFMHLDRIQTEKILQECYRILKKNGRLIFDLPSKKRRQMVNYKTSAWHGASHTSLSEARLDVRFKLMRTRGILFFPIHRIPQALRRHLIKPDIILGRSIFKEYCSYLILEFIKR
jgi:ubiquinone/menaquinone biosynthesis C-methylase UbiE